MPGSIDGGVANVFGVVQGVRRRWKLSRFLRGTAVALGGSLVTLLLAALILDALRYPPSAVIAARVVFIVVVLALAGRFVVLPLLPRPRDEQVALYLEERAPSLDGALISAVEVSRDPIGAQSAGGSTTLASLLRRMALDRARAVNYGRGIDTAVFAQAGVGLVVAIAALALTLAVGPEGMRYGMGALLTPWQRADQVNPFRIDVEPGDATIARGASVLVSATPVGFQPDGAELWARTGDSASWMRVPMTADSASRLTARLLDVSSVTEYLVETSGMRSRIFRLDVRDLPYTKRIDLEYRFPAYTGLPVQRVDSAGDIAAVTGTTVRVRITPTVPTSGGRLVVDAGDTIALAPQADGTLAASLRVRRSGFYRVELEGTGGALLTASLDYAIDALPDRPPSVRFARPGRDSKVLAVDEVYTEAVAEDDYGVARLDLVYSVNGSAEKSVPLHSATARVIRDIAAGHTFMLEEYALEPGDVIAYHARATDNDAVEGAKSATSDIYFMQVRPYAQEYRQSQQAGGGGGGQGGEQEGQLSQRQRDIIAGTFNTSRDSASADSKTLAEDAATLRLAQQRLREDVENLARRLVDRGVVSRDSNLATIAKILPVASAAMDTAEQQLAGMRLRDALRPEQRALQQLQRAEALYREVQVSMGQQGGGGGGGGGGSQAEDLADLFELQQERMRNQYETVQRGGEEAQAEQQVDETMERLRQLAARQQQEDERARRKADSLGRMGASGSSSGESQRQLAQEAEQAARQLERLAREQESRALGEAARRMNEAADAMRRAAASRGERGAAESAEALRQLRDATRLLENERENRTRRAAEEAAEAGRRIAEQQRRIREDVARQEGASAAERDELQQRVADRKGALADSVRELGTRLDRASLEARRTHPEAGREMAEAADTMRARRIEDKVRTTQRALRYTPQEYQRLNEQIISSDIEELNKALEEARVRAQTDPGRSDERRNAEALDRARQLVQGLESMDERAQQQREGQGQEGQQGQGQQGREGQQGGGQPGAQGDGDNQYGVGSPGGGGGQMRRELRQRLNDARALRRQLQGRDLDLSELDRAIGRMERLSGAPSDAVAESELREQVIEGLKSFEFGLSRAFGVAPAERVLVDRAEDVPPQYRKYVEEYYRSLGRVRP